MLSSELLFLLIILAHDLFNHSHSFLGSIALFLNLCDLLSDLSLLFLLLIDKVELDLQIVDPADHLIVALVQLLVDLGELIETTQINILAPTVIILSL